MIKNLFSTPIKIINLPNFISVTEKIFSFMQIRKENFTKKLPRDEAEKIEELFKEEAESYLKECAGRQIDLELTSAWLNITQKFEINSPHVHPNNTVAGVYYINTNEKSGDLLLHDPKGSSSLIPHSDVTSNGDIYSNRTFYRYKPKVGDLILFPAYLIHSVEANMSDEIRISLAINFIYKNYEQFNKL